MSDMGEKKLPLVQIAILIQSLILLVIGAYGEMSFRSMSLSMAVVILTWIGLFAVIDYVYEENIKHAIKMGFVFAVIWCAVETILEFVLY